MYSPNSSVLSTINDHPVSTSTYLSASNSPTILAKPSNAAAKCLRFKYFTTFLICTTCLALLAASLATHKWIVSRPIRVLRLNSAQTNFTSLMLTVASLEEEDQRQQLQAAGQQHQRQSRQHDTSTGRRFSSPPPSQHQNKQDSSSASELYLSGQMYSTGGGAGGQSNNKFQGEVYFGLFNGVKVLNYGFGDRVSQISGEWRAHWRSPGRLQLQIYSSPEALGPSTRLRRRVDFAKFDQVFIGCAPVDAQQQLTARAP